MVTFNHIFNSFQFRCVTENWKLTFAGIFVLNLVSRDEQLRDNVLVDLKKTFKTVVSYKLDEDVNEVLFCQNIEYDAKKFNVAMEKSVQFINDLMEKAQNSSKTIDLTEFMEQLKV